MSQNRNLPAIAIICILLWARPAWADFGLPMIVFTFPITALALVPIVLIEMQFIHRDLQMSTMRALLGSAVANVVSTILGIPFTWVCLAFVSSSSANGKFPVDSIILRNLFVVTWQAAWIPPYDDLEMWVVPAACMSLLMPFFLASVWTETLVIRLMHPDLDRAVIRRCMVRANKRSYLLLALIILFWLIAELMGYSVVQIYGHYFSPKVKL